MSVHNPPWLSDIATGAPCGLTSLSVLGVAVVGCGIMLRLMDWQEVMALGIVAGTAAAFALRRLRRRKFSFERDTPCGCAPGTGSAPPSVTYRARKGERPQVVVKIK